MIVSIARRAACLLPVLAVLATWPAAAQNTDEAAQLPATNGFVDGIAAIVDKDVITLRELRLRSEQARDELARQHIQAPQDAILQRQVLQRLIQERIEDHEAARFNIRVNDQVVDQAIDAIAQRNHLTVEQLREQVEQSTSWQSYRHSVHRDILYEQLRQQVIERAIIITDSEVQAFLKDQQAQRDIGALDRTSAPAATLALAQILVRVPEDASSEQLAALRRKADDLLARARRGEDFAALAAAASDGPEALEGGAMGVRALDGWPDLFVNAVAALPVGQIADLIQSGNGFHILKVLDRQNAAAASDGADLSAAQGPMPVTQTHARHILLKTSVTLSDDQARHRLAQLRRRVVEGGENFADLARRYSADASAPQGGDLGWLNPGETVPAFEQAMDQLEDGQISEPIQSPFGWHLIQVEARRVQDMADEFQRMQARRTLFERRAQAEFEDWLDQVRNHAYVDNRLEKREQLEQIL